MPAPGLGSLGRCSLVDLDCRSQKRVRRSCIRTRFILNLRQSRSDATGKERRENGARSADEEFAFPRRPELLCRAGLVGAANGGITSMEPGTTSGIEGISAFRSALKSGAS